ncbi:MAG: hypothetical protein C5B59_20270 [Bacteroidetes bacterium]|nr:MAG: hypothetical protein C5B59_20270 [Bacteroidota bacterium]
MRSSESKWVELPGGDNRSVMIIRMLKGKRPVLEMNDQGNNDVQNTTELILDLLQYAAAKSEKFMPCLE